MTSLRRFKKGPSGFNVAVIRPHISGSYSAASADGSCTARERIDKRATFFIAHPSLAVFITNTEARESVIYSTKGNRFVEEKKVNFDVGLN